VKHVARVGQNTESCKILVSRHERNIPLGRPKLRWKDNIEMDLKLVGFRV
jgi:hypothetical protein